MEGLQADWQMDRRPLHQVTSALRPEAEEESSLPAFLPSASRTCPLLLCSHLPGSSVGPCPSVPPEADSKASPGASTAPSGPGAHCWPHLTGPRSRSRGGTACRQSSGTNSRPHPTPPHQGAVLTQQSGHRRAILSPAGRPGVVQVPHPGPSPGLLSMSWGPSMPEPEGDRSVGPGEPGARRPGPSVRAPGRAADRQGHALPVSTCSSSGF